MSFKLIFKTLFIIALLALLVLMGMSNKEQVRLSMPQILPHSVQQPAAIMYFGFFGIGFMAGTIIMAGGGKKSGGKSKVDT